MYLILHYLKRYKTYVFFNILAILGFAAAELGIPTIVSRMIDNGIVLNLSLIHISEPTRH